MRSGYSRTPHSDLVDPVISGLTDSEYGLYTRLRLWCSINETDGRFSVAQVSLLCRRRGFMSSLKRLCDVGIVSVSGNDYVLERYLSENTSKQRIEEKRAAFREAKAAQRAALSQRDNIETPARPSTKNKEQRTENKDSEESPRRARKTKCPEDFSPDETCEALARELGFSRREWKTCLDEFIDYWRGEGKMKTNWQATFRNRIRAKAEQLGKAAPREETPQQSEYQRRMARAEAITADETTGTIPMLYGGER